MARKRFTPEQVITMLREAEVLLSQSNPIGEVCRKLGISDQLVPVTSGVQSSQWPPVLTSQMCAQRMPTTV